MVQINDTTSNNNVESSKLESKYDSLLEKYKEFRKGHPFASEEKEKWNVIAECHHMMEKDNIEWENVVHILAERPLIQKWAKIATDEFDKLFEKYKNEYVTILNSLINGEKEIGGRLDDYKKSVDDLYKSGVEVKSIRTATLLLTCKNPLKYTLLIPKTYENICGYLYEKKREGGGRYPHFLKMLEPLVDKIKNDTFMQTIVTKELEGMELESVNLLLAQDVVCNMKNVDNGICNDVNMDARDLVSKYKSFLLKNHNMIFTGAPGTGKTYLAKEIAASIIEVDAKNLKGNEQFGFVQFHPSYDYTDFVEGLRPSDKEGKEFELCEGTFKQFCAEAQKYEEDEDKKFVFVIDEINRGEISKIFGELFFSIDPGYRGVDGCAKTQYQNMVKDGPFKDGFYVPKNVYIIGTMNDIDRSVESLDFAFRRRFPSIEITYDATLYSICDEIKKDKDEKFVNLVDDASKRLKNLNTEIEKLEELGPEYCIGGAYLTKLADVNSKEELWEYYIKPVIAEYFRGLPVREREEKIDNLENIFLKVEND